MVSHYVADKLMLKCETRLIKDLLESNMVHCNPSLLGNLLELQFLATLRRQAELEQGLIKVKDKSRVETWNVLKFVDGVDFIKPDLCPSLRSCWLVPKDFNHPAFDIVHIDDKVVRVVQIAQGKKHDYKLYHVANLLKNLRKSGRKFDYIDVVVVIPAEQNNFELDTITDDYYLKKLEKDKDGNR